jgi:hypothetical protein
LAGLALEIPPDLSVGLAVDRIPLVLWVGLVVEIPLARSVALADGATASGCCDSRHSEGARCLIVQHNLRKKSKAQEP